MSFTFNINFCETSLGNVIKHVLSNNFLSHDFSVQTNSLLGTLTTGFLAVCVSGYIRLQHVDISVI